MSNKVSDMTVGKPLRLIVAFAVPMLISSVFQQLYNVIDSVVVGRLIGINAFAAIGATGFLYSLVLGTVMGFSQGFGALFAQRFGAKDIAGLRRAIAQSVVLTAALGAVFTAMFLLLLKPLLLLINTPAEILDDACIYLYWICAAMPISFAYNTAGAVLRALGNSRAPLVAVIIASIVNIVLDLFFVGVAKMGVEGVAIATVIATACSLVYCLLILRKIELVHIQKKDFTENAGRTTYELFRLGMPLAFRNLIIGVGGLVIQYVVNGFGTLYVAGIAAAHKYFGIINIMGVALDGSTVVFVGQNFGANKLVRIKEGMRTVRIFAVVSALVIAAISVIFGKEMIGLLITGNVGEIEAVKQIGYNNLLAFSVCLPELYLLYTHRSALQGMGNSLVPMISGFTELAMRIVAVLILPAWIEDWGIYIADGIGWIGAAILLVFSYEYVYKKRMKAVQADAAAIKQ